MAKSQRPKTRTGRHAADKKSPTTLATVGIGVLVLAVLGYAINNALVAKRTATAPVEIEGIDDPARLMEMAKGIPVGGDPNAPIEIWEFADYSCSHCKEFHEIIESRLDIAYLNDGRAQLVMFDYPMPVGPHSFLAARAARCAGDQGKYAEYADVLFDNQALWAPASGVPVGTFTDYAETLGLDAGTFRSCLQSNQHAEVVTANRALGDQLGVNGTPSVYIQKRTDRLFRPVEGATYENIAAILDELLGQAAPAADSTPPSPEE